MFIFKKRCFGWRLFANKKRAGEINYLCENSAFRQGKDFLVVRRRSAVYGNSRHGVALFVRVGRGERSGETHIRHRRKHLSAYEDNVFSYAYIRCNSEVFSAPRKALFLGCEIDWIACGVSTYPHLVLHLQRRIWAVTGLAQHNHIYGVCHRRIWGGIPSVGEETRGEQVVQSCLFRGGCNGSVVCCFHLFATRRATLQKSCIKTKAIF